MRRAHAAQSHATAKANASLPPHSMPRECRCRRQSSPHAFLEPCRHNAFRPTAEQGPDGARRVFPISGTMRGDFMKASLKVFLLFKVLLFSFTAIGIAGPALAQSNTATSSTSALQYAKQGWTVDDRQAFYTTSQGSHMIP